MSEDSREYYPNRPLATTAANRGQREFETHGVYSATAQFVPDKGFVAVLFSDRNIPEAWDAGFEVRLQEFIPSETPKDWATGQAKKPKASTGGGSSGSNPPVKGATAKVWQIADRMHAETPLTKADRGRVIAACEAEGINPATAGTQWGKWKKARGI